MVKSKQNELPEAGFVRLPGVLRVFPVGKSTWWNGVAEGKYPAPVKLSKRVSAWRVGDIRRLKLLTSLAAGFISSRTLLGTVQGQNILYVLEPGDIDRLRA